jgi:hypothetical protein
MRNKGFWFVVTFGASVAIIALGEARAHGGGLDAYGCHNDYKSGTYHCHRQPRLDMRKVGNDGGYLMDKETKAKERKRAKEVTR